MQSQSACHPSHRIDACYICSLWRIAEPPETEKRRNEVSALWHAEEHEMVEIPDSEREENKRINDILDAIDELSIEDTVAMFENAARYRWHKARNPGALLATAWGASKAACAIGDDPDAATDVAMLESPVVGAA